MAKSSGPSRPTGNADERQPGRPDVIVEFVFDCGHFHLAIRNIGDQPAHAVSVKFDKKFSGAGGAKQISELPLFKNIEFLGPGREISTFVDTSHSYFQRRQPTRMSARVFYRDAAGGKYESTINHDLEIYRDLLYLARREHDCGDKKDH